MFPRGRVIRSSRVGVRLLALVAAFALSGCVDTVAGTAVRAQHTAPTPEVPELSEGDLDRVLVSIGDLNEIVGATRMRVDDTSTEMTDHSDDVSDPDCLAVIYGAEDKVYGRSGWTALRDQVAREPTDDNDHWVEQAAVLYPSAQKATAFFESMRSTWQKCSGTTIETYGDDFIYWWDIGDLAAGEKVLTQTVKQQDADDWACQHALQVASNLIVEAWACSYDVGDEAEGITSAMLVNAAKK